MIFSCNERNSAVHVLAPIKFPNNIFTSMTDILSASGSVPASRVLCNVCNARYAIYTCPCCKLRTCSLPCSSNHKITTNCSGERDKAAFVTMRDYSWGTLMSDYTYLEEVGRKVGEWGEVIGKGSYATNQLGRGSARGMRGGRGGNFRGRGGGNFSHPKTKRDILKAQLEMYDISMDLLPVGMERRQHNQSIWDFKYVFLSFYSLHGLTWFIETKLHF